MARRSNDTAAGARPGRIESVDQFRGFAVISMIIINYLALFSATPAWLKHAPGTGLTFADIVAPYFVFVIGLMYGTSFSSRLRRSGARRTRIHFLRRYGLLIAIGAAMSAVGYLGVRAAIHFSPGTVVRTAGERDVSAWASSVLYWGVLQAIGAAGIIALLAARFSPPLRFLGGAVLLAAHELLMEYAGTGFVLRYAHGGPQGVLGWGALLLFSTALCGEIKGRSRRRSSLSFLAFGVLLTAGGVLLSKALPVSKDLVSAPYVLVSAGLSSLTFLLFFLLADCAGARLPHLTILGRNALLLYVIHEALVAAGGATLGHDAGRLAMAAGAVCIYMLCYLLARTLDRRGKYLKL